MRSELRQSDSSNAVKKMCGLASEIYQVLDIREPMRSRMSRVAVEEAYTNTWFHVVSDIIIILLYIII